MPTSQIVIAYKGTGLTQVIAGVSKVRAAMAAPIKTPMQVVPTSAAPVSQNQAGINALKASLPQAGQAPAALATGLGKVVAAANAAAPAIRAVAAAITAVNNAAASPATQALAAESKKDAADQEALHKRIIGWQKAQAKEAQKAAADKEKAAKKAEQAVKKLASEEKKAGQEANRSAAAVESGFRRVERSVLKAANVVTSFGNQARMVLQGIMSISKAFSMTVTPAIIGAFVYSGKAAIDFDESLVRVAKTTGITGKNFTKLSSHLRELALHTSTSVVDLAKIAEQLGQVGVTDVDRIKELTHTFDMLSTSTDISADTVGISMGRIANAFGIDLNTAEGTTQIAKLSSVINRLENEMAATAPQILDFMDTFAQTGSLFKTDDPLKFAAQMAGLGSTLTSVGFSSSEAGTAMRRFLAEIVQNVDKVQDLMGGIKGWGSEQEILNRINTDAVQVVQELAAAAGNGNGAAQVLFKTLEVGGDRGGKAWAALASSTDLAGKSIALVNDELKAGNSLYWEHQRALLSTKGQLGVLRNGFNEVVLVLGDTLLPVINQVIQTIIPLVRTLAKSFQTMSEKNKLMIVGLAMLVAVAGPVVLFLSQIGFGLAMASVAAGGFVKNILQIAFAVARLFRGIVPLGKIIASFGSLFKKAGVAIKGFGGLFGTLTSLFGSFGGAISGFVSGLFSAASAVFVVIGSAVGFLIGGVVKAMGVGEEIAEFFFQLASNAREWGANIVNTFAGGMLSAVATTLANVMQSIGNFIGKYLAGNSPPDMGPLSHIDLWGKNVFDAFLEGFKQADFGVLADIGERIKRIIDTFVKVGLAGDQDPFKFTLEARKNLAELIKVFNETGKISEELLAATVKDVGEQKEEVSKLVVLWLKYNKIQQDLADLEKRKKGVLKGYEAEVALIAKSNMSAEEKVEAIRAAMRGRNDELRVIEQEKEGLEEQEDAAKGLLEVQKEMLEAMQRQDELQLGLIDALKGGSDDPNIGGKAWTLPEGVFDGIRNAIQGFETLEEKIGRAQLKWEAFLAGLQGTGDRPEWIMPTDQGGVGRNGIVEDVGGTPTDFFDQQKAFDFGAKIKAQIDIARGAFDSVFGEGGSISGLFNGLFGEGGTVGTLLTGLFGEGGTLTKSLDELPGKITAAFTGIVVPQALLDIAAAFQKGFDWANLFFDKVNSWITLVGFDLVLDGIAEALTNIGLSFDTNKGKWDAFSIVVGAIAFSLGVIAAALLPIALLIVLLGGVITLFIAKLFEAWLFLGELKDMLAKIVELVLLKVITGFNEVKDFLHGWFDDRKMDFVAFLWTIGDKVRAGLAKVVEGWIWIFTVIRNRLVEFFAHVESGWTKLLNTVKGFIETKVAEWKALFETKISEIQSLFSVDTLKTAGVNLIQGLWNGISEKWEEFKKWWAAASSGILETIKDIFNIQSPSVVMEGVGKNIGAGLENGLSASMDSAKAAFSASLGGMINEPVGAGAGVSGGGMTLVFNRDSVRSDADIKAIADQVQRVYEKKARGAMNMRGSK